MKWFVLASVLCCFLKLVSGSEGFESNENKHDQLAEMDRLAIGTELLNEIIPNTMDKEQVFWINDENSIKICITIWPETNAFGFENNYLENSRLWMSF